MSPAPFYTLTAGDLTVTAVSDGLMSAPLSLLSGISREEAEAMIMAARVKAGWIEPGAEEPAEAEPEAN